MPQSFNPIPAGKKGGGGVARSYGQVIRVHVRENGRDQRDLRPVWPERETRPAVMRDIWTRFVPGAAPAAVCLRAG